jgi:hypothetical protein
MEILIEEHVAHSAARQSRGRWTCCADYPIRALYPLYRLHVDSSPYDRVY